MYQSLLQKYQLNPHPIHETKFEPHISYNTQEVLPVTPIGMHCYLSY